MEFSWEVQGIRSESYPGDVFASPVIPEKSTLSGPSPNSAVPSLEDPFKEFAH